jgi:hypothetical protein
MSDPHLFMVYGERIRQLLASLSIDQDRFVVEEVLGKRKLRKNVKE